MATYLFIATAIGLFIAQQTDGDWNLASHTLKEKYLTSITVSDKIVVVGSTEGAWHSSDNGKTWRATNENLAKAHVRWVTHASNNRTIFLAGTEPAGIFVSRDGGNTWSSRPEVSKLRDANGWFLPYSKAAGCVRGFAVARPEHGYGRIYAAVEVGGILISDDGGTTWRLVEGSDGSPNMNRVLGTMIHPDVHSLTVHPTSPDLVTAATGGGLYRSSDGGRSWENIYRCYIRAVWVDPADDRHLIAGPADGVSRRGRIEETYDGGQIWHVASDGMMPVPWSGHMVERFFHFDNALFAVLSNGALWSRSLDETTWRRVLSEVKGIKAVALRKE
jgi:photosystem II stability/assembly factor-like uncharacterized protein